MPVPKNRPARSFAPSSLGGGDEAKFLSRSGKHVLKAGGWLVYLAGSMHIGEVTIHELRDVGYHNFLTNHYSNFFEGLGFMGVFHHSVCALRTACMAGVSKVIPRMKEKMVKLTRPVHEAFNRKREFLRSNISRYEVAPMLLTSTLFTAVNAMFEISPAVMNGNWAARGNDWTDFFVGEAGLVVYYVAKNIVSNRLADLEKRKATSGGTAGSREL